MYGKLESLSEEGAIACVAVGLISSIFSIVVAPWQIHLALVLSIIVFRARPFGELSILNRLTSTVPLPNSTINPLKWWK
ncbi:MAG: hypothetical protein F6K09_09175 [Merismopedia sp. SIO2A8]|nr:hypothetical protein [Merismopedia sp. SIO2A8]